MIRSLAAVLAKKAAIVAITGVVVIGGATFALANVDDPPVDDPAVEESSEEEAPAEDELAEVEGAEEESGGDEGTEDDDAGDDVTDEEGAEEDGAEDADLAEDTDEGELTTTQDPEVDIVKDNHGAVVSQAAQGGAPCEGLTGRDKGQCVANVATGGKKAAEEPTTAPAPPDADIESGDETADETVDATVAPASVDEPAKGKPSHAEGKGNGKGAKG